MEQEILLRLKVELGNEWNRNFLRRSFFTEPWPERKLPGPGKLLDVSGALRGSIRSEIREGRVHWRSSLPYAGIMNEGGEIVVTRKMKSFFWAKYYSSLKQIRYRRDGKMSKTSQKAGEAAEIYRSLALKKAGDRIVIPARRFTGNAPEVEAAVRKITDASMSEVEKYIKSVLTGPQ
jgi:phage gpG-like protein